MRATLGGIEFISDPTPTELQSGDALYLVDEGGLGGWFGGVESRHESTARPTAHGDFDAPAFLGPRIISIRGSVVASNAVDVENALASLSDLVVETLDFLPDCGFKICRCEGLAVDYHECDWRCWWTNRLSCWCRLRLGLWLRCSYGGLAGHAAAFRGLCRSSQPQRDDQQQGGNFMLHRVAHDF